MITGGTGFLGVRLLPLLARENLVLLCRPGPVPPADRLTTALHAAGVPRAQADRLCERVEIIAADVTRPRLGLDERRFRALAARTGVIWHSAGEVTLAASRYARRMCQRVNVEGTRQVLDLAAAADQPVLHHVSTAFVAGSRPDGVIDEVGEDTAEEFENPYEQSKADGERLVRDWAHQGGTAVVHRPTILVSDRPARAGAPTQPLHILMKIADRVLGGAFGADPDGDGPPTVRLSYHPKAHLNLMPVDRAAAQMVQLAERHRPAPGTVHTCHLSYPHEVSIADTFAQIDDLVPVRIQLVPQPVTDPTALEALTHRAFGGFMPYLHHRRHYTRTALQAAGLDRPAPPLDTAFLRRVLTSARITRPDADRFEELSVPS
ncbi:SDR family oxidoreductase [Spirillospora sp. CA-294931]|uniref:SDR family oxidoreductase n=1 Tax=Spirillospora sp. CA-294931 TaxID=3240042 RepID=UPI003D903CED